MSYPVTEIDTELAPGSEQVVLLDDAGRAIGAADKSAVHHRHTPLHLAFSCYVFDRGGDLLVSQRAMSKATFPGVWTNSACGHPGPGEGFIDAVTRRTRQELGIGLRELRVVLPRFRYYAVMSNGVAENEICPVAMAVTDDSPRIDPGEVEATRWLPWVGFRDAVLARRWAVSPWCLEQVEQLAGLGDDPLTWPAAPLSALPPAAAHLPAQRSDT